MENSVAVVSFSERNKDLHLKIARSVISSFEIHQVYLVGMTNISTIGLPSKVSVVSSLSRLVNQIMFFKNVISIGQTLNGISACIFALAHYKFNEICSKKVCLVFVDKNERNIILETDVDVSRTRAGFVEGQIKKGKIASWFYCLMSRLTISYSYISV